MSKHPGSALGSTIGGHGYGDARCVYGGEDSIRDPSLQIAQTTELRRADSTGALLRDMPCNAPIGNPVLIVLVGHPASGKSTWAQQNGAGAVHVSQDGLIDAITPDGFEHVYRSIYTAAEDAIARAALSAGHTVIVDRTNRTASPRAVAENRPRVRESSGGGMDDGIARRLPHAKCRQEGTAPAE
jgi:hypothetical protein